MVSSENSTLRVSDSHFLWAGGELNGEIFTVTAFIGNLRVTTIKSRVFYSEFNSTLTIQHHFLKVTSYVNETFGLKSCCHGGWIANSNVVNV